MTARSILDIELNDEKFNRFIEKFNAYRAALENLPGAWGKTDEAVKSTGSSFGDMAAAIMAQSEMLHQAAINQSQMAKGAGRTNNVMKDLARNTKSVAGNIISATKALLKWTGIISAVSGLLGAGGIWGIDRLAANASHARLSAQGLDIKPSEKQAFEINYQRLLPNPEGFLGNINEIIHDQTKQYGLGSDVASMARQGMSPADIAAAILPRLRRTFEASGKTVAGMEAYGLQNFGSLNDFIGLENQKPEDFEAAQTGYQRDKSKLAVPDSTYRAFQNFKVQLDEAAQQVENVFIRALSPLAPQLSQLSNAFADAIETVLTSKQLREWIPRLAEGIKDFANYLTSPMFKADIAKFTEAIGELASGVLAAARFLGLIDQSAPNPNEASNSEISQYNVRHPEHQLPLDPTRGPWDRRRPGEDNYNADRPFDALNPDSYFNHLPGTAPWEKGGPKAPWDFSAVEKREGLPADLLSDIAWHESRFNPTVVSSKGAAGLMQFMPDTAKQYGLKNRFDPVASIDAAGRLMHDLVRDFNGDIRKAIAAYSAGETAIKRDIQEYGAQWDQHLPKETSDYLRDILKQLGQKPGSSGAPPSVKIVLQNQTGNSASMIGSQVAQ